MSYGRVAAIGVVAVVSAVAQFPAAPLASNDPLQRLQDVARSMPRAIEPRISGFAWSPLGSPKRGGANEDDIPQLRLMGAAGAVLEAKTQGVADREAAAAARLLTHRPYAALAILESIDEWSRTAATWNDLAATHLAIAADEDAPEHFKDALAAADEALRLDPRSPEALFNRALVIEHFGLRRAAREAWQRYLEHDHDSGWATEATGRVQRLATPAKDFRRALDLAYDKLANGDLAIAGELVANFPQETRTWAEVEILGRWAEASQRGDGSAAARHLAVARTLASALRTHNREELLADCVSAIDHAGDEARTASMNAFLAYRRGRLIYSQQRPAEAETLLRDAASLFERARNPMALVARYYVANTIFDRYRSAEARAQLDRLALLVPDRYRALRAQLAWESGLCDFAAARWEAAATAFSTSAAIFDDLGEARNEAVQHGLVADVHERLGDFRDAWRERLRAVAALSAASDLSFRAALSGLARVAMMERTWRAAWSLVNLETEVASPERPDSLLIEALFHRAVIAARRGDRAASRTTLAEAEAALRLLGDPAARERFANDLHFAAVLASDPRDPDTIVRLTEAAAFHREKGRRMYLPEILLTRSRAYRAGGDRAAAWSDLVAGIAEVESQRTSSPTGLERASIFDASRELFTDAVSMRLEDGAVRDAFAYADRFRGRVLLDSLGASVPGSAEPLNIVSRHTTVVEYLLGKGELTAFVAARGNVRAVTTKTDEQTLRRQTAAFAEAAGSGDEARARELGEKLYAILIAPLESSLESDDEIVIVPDDGLQQLPYSALYDARSRHFLVEQHAVIVTPSAAVYLSASAHGARRGDDAPHLLVVGAPLAKTADSLGSAEREASEVSALYPSSSLLAGASATRNVFLQSAATADVIHFAGHGVATNESNDAALLFATQGSDDGRLYSADLAKVTLTRPRLVVLAACSTAVGRTRGGDGPWSIARAFLAAGVPTVVATLWPIDDESSRLFFTDVHRHLRGGSSPAQAVRAVQIDSIAHARPLPLWAGTQVLGSP